MNDNATTIAAHTGKAHIVLGVDVGFSIYEHFCHVGISSFASLDKSCISLLYVNRKNSFVCHVTHALTVISSPGNYITYNYIILLN